MIKPREFLLDFRYFAVFIMGGYNMGDPYPPWPPGVPNFCGVPEIRHFFKGRYNLEKIIRRLSTGGGLIPANFCWVFRYFAVCLRGVAIWGIHIRPGLRGYLIPAGPMKFGRFPKGDITPRR